MAVPPSNEAKERAERKALLKQTLLRDSDGREFSARLRNLSATGLGGICDARLAAGQKATAELDGIGSVHGQVVWVDDLAFGMEFEEAIDPEKLIDGHRKLASMPTKYTVPDRFKPVESFRRPGFAN